MEMLERLSTMMIAASTMAPTKVIVDSTVQEKNVNLSARHQAVSQDHHSMLEAC
jgi:hypothetical protein